VDHAFWSSHRERHVQGVKHQPSSEGRGHRPADDPTAARIQHDRKVEKACPGRDVGDVGHPQQIGPLRCEVAVDQVRRLTTAALHCGGDELASAHTGKTCRRHQPGDALAADANAFGSKIDMNARRPVDARGLAVKGPVSGEEYRTSRTEGREFRRQSLLDEFSISKIWARERQETGCVSAETGSNPRRDPAAADGRRSCWPSQARWRAQRHDRDQQGNEGKKYRRPHRSGMRAAGSVRTQSSDGSDSEAIELRPAGAEANFILAARAYAPQ
jgi:hypothetical protein